MRNSEPLTLDYLFQSASLATFEARSKSLSALNNAVCQCLPKLLQEQCRVANYRQGVLIIEVSSASWLTRLRYEQESLIVKLRQSHLIGLASIQYKINPKLSKTRFILKSEQQTTGQRKMSPQSASILLTLAQNATPQLKSHLIKLANHATKIDNNQE